jgi:hypothetical protein
MQWGRLQGTQEKYGQTFVKLMVAEKSKEVVNDEFGKLNSKSNETFQGFNDRTSNMVGEKTKALSGIFEDLKNKVNSTVPGGIPALEPLTTFPVSTICKDR